MAGAAAIAALLGSTKLEEGGTGEGEEVDRDAEGG